MMRVLQLVTQLHLNSKSGSPRHVLELSQALVREGVEVILITGRGATPEMQERVRRSGVKLHEFEYHDLRSFPECFAYPRELCAGVANAVQAVLSCLEPGRATVLHAHHLPHSPVVAETVDRHVGLPYMTTTHGSDLYEGLEDERYQRVLRRNRYGAFLVGLNRAMMPRLAELAGTSNLECVPGGLDPADHVFRLPSSRRAEAQFLYVGRLLADKGADELPAILADLVNRCEGAHLTIAGDGAMRIGLEREFAERGLANHVTFTGWIPREEVQALMQEHAILLCPTVWPEPFARVLLEAAAAGLPVVTRNRGGNAEILGDDYFGLLPEEASIGDLAQAVTALVRDPGRRDTMAARARAHVEANYAWQSIGKRYLDLFERTITAHS